MTPELSRAPVTEEYTRAEQSKLRPTFERLHPLLCQCHNISTSASAITLALASRYISTSALQCRYILNSVRFRTDSNSVRKTNLNKFNKIFQTELDSVRKQKTIFKPRKNSEPNPIRFGKKVQGVSKKTLFNEIGTPGGPKTILRDGNHSKMLSNTFLLVRRTTAVKLH